MSLYKSHHYKYFRSKRNLSTEPLNDKGVYTIIHNRINKNPHIRVKILTSLILKHK